MRVVDHQHRKLGHIAHVGARGLQRDAQVLHRARDLARKIRREPAGGILAALPRHVHDARGPLHHGHVRIAVGTRVIQALGIEQAERGIGTGKRHRGQRGREGEHGQLRNGEQWSRQYQTST
ncbi:hypothetical protein D3C72_1871440 [compost metagenome]